jgi:hypothetical protein
MKKKTLILATSIGLALVVATLVLTPVLTTKATSASGNAANASGAIVIAWN